MSDSSRPMYELAATVVLPTVVLVGLSGPERLGPTLGLVVALAFPIAWGVYSMVRDRQISTLSVIAIVGVLLTGSVGLLELDPSWFAVKEAAIPFLIGALTMATASTRFALLPVVLDRLFDDVRLHEALGDKRPDYDALTRRGTIIAGAVVMAGGVVSYILARIIVTSPTGTSAFASELGTHTTLSFLLVGLPTTVAMAFVLRDVLVKLHGMTGIDPETLFRNAEPVTPK